MSPNHLAPRALPRALILPVVTSLAFAAHRAPADDATPRPAISATEPTSTSPPTAPSISIATPPAGSTQAPPAPTLTVVDRAIAQDQGHWQVDYRLRYDGPTAVLAGPGDLSAAVDAWVSNSRVAGHECPKHARHAIRAATSPSATAELVASPDEGRRCRERAVFQVWEGDASAAPPVPAVGSDGQARAPLNLAPGAILSARLRLEHQHVVFGDYDPLLGVRQVDIKVGEAALHDEVPLDREHRRSQARGDWPAPPPDRRDPRRFVSAPDSLHLEAHIPGNQYYRFPERPVRYATLMRLQFWYLIAPGSEGESRVRIAQYKETPTAWKPLADGCREQTLAVVGRWVKVEQTFRTEPDATTLALEFRVAGTEPVGELWIDDVTLDPIAEVASGP